MLESIEAGSDIIKHFEKLLTAVETIKSQTPELSKVIRDFATQPPFDVPLGAVSKSLANDFDEMETLSGEMTEKLRQIVETLEQAHARYMDNITV